MQLDHRQAGDHVPETDFRIRDGETWRDLGYDELFTGRTVVVFALSGAFTPTCTSTHLPGFSMLAEEFKAKGVDGIYCLSVNDWFVMEAWRKSLNVGDEVTMLPDGNTDFTDQMGMLVEKRNLGFGERSWRYAMIVKDGVIESIFVEDTQDPDDPFKFSSAPYVLKHLS